MKDIPKREDYGNGTYRRRIHLLARGPRVFGELEDDFHHFRVERSAGRDWRVIQSWGEVRVSLWARSSFR